MTCQKCNYALSQFDKTCPRCELNPTAPRSVAPRLPAAAREPSFLSVAPLRIAAAIFAAAGLCGLLYFGVAFDTSVAVPTVNILGTTVGGGRVNNLGLMQERSNGLMLAGGSFALGVVLYALDFLQTKRG